MQINIEELTDRELLELAAKAAGRTLEWGGSLCWLSRRLSSHVINDGPWCPLEDGNASQDLAAHLHLSIQPDDTCVEVTAPDCYAVDGVCPWSIAKYADHNGEKSEAWRWAVLQVAAQIGRSMP